MIVRPTLSSVSCSLVLSPFANFDDASVDVSNIVTDKIELACKNINKLDLLFMFDCSKTASVL